MNAVLGGWSKRRTVSMRALALLATVWIWSEIGSAQGASGAFTGRTGPGGTWAQPEADANARLARPGQDALRFLHGRVGSGGGPGALAAGRAEHAAMLRAQSVQSPIAVLNAAWQPVGPLQVESPAYGKISGRVSSIAIDPADATGNTVYLGTTGGGIWRSINAAGPAGSVTFVPLTDNLQVFSGSFGSSATTSLSIGAISVQAGGIVLAGTGDPNDALDSYYGGGILRSEDGGRNWTLVENSKDGNTGWHYFRGLGFAGFAWSTVNPSLVVAAVSQSAEGTIVNATTQYSVMGLYVSSDAGLTWQMSTISDGPQQIVQTPMTPGANGGGVAATAVVWNPVRQRFYAVIRYHGYYESTDGLAWTRMASQPGTSMSLKSCPSEPGSDVSLSCPVFRGSIAVQPSTGDMFALTTSRSNVDQGLWQDVCGSTGSGCNSAVATFGKRLKSAPLDGGPAGTVIAQADYNMTLAAMPDGADTLLFVGTTDLYRCSIGAGCLLRNTTNAANACGAPSRVAPGQHALATGASGSMLFLGNDGGLWRSGDKVNQQGPVCSADDASHFENLNGGLGSLAEVISFAQDPRDQATLLVGLGAGGTASSSQSASGAWPQVSGGEGGTVAINQDNPLLWYISTAAGVSIRRCAMGGACAAADFIGAPTIGATQTNADASVLEAPWILDQAMSSNVVIGTCRVWRGPVDLGSQWSGANQLSATMGGPQNSTCNPTTNAFVRSLAVAGPGVSSGAVQNLGSSVIYAGMAGSLSGGGASAGHVFVTFNADAASSSTHWTDLSKSPVANDWATQWRFNPNGFDISSLAADSHDTTGKTIYAAVMGFSQSGASAPHVYGSTDGGSHWINLSSNLPNAPANSVIVDPNDANTLYIALDTGVYVTTSVTSCPTSNCWSVYGLSLPNAPAVQLSAAPLMGTGDGRTGMLRVGTYGRGIWQIPLLTAAYAAQPSIAVSPSEVSFTDQAVGTLSPTQTVLVTNTGNAPLLVSSAASTGDFSTADDCGGSTVAVNGSCAIHIRFLPAATGSRKGVLTLHANVSGGQATVTLSGNGTPPGNLVLTPTALTFPSTTMNASSAPQNISVSNVGGGSVTLQSPIVTGDFKIGANTCGSSLAASTGCTVAVIFAPSAGGLRSGALEIAGSAGTQAASLTGTGTAPATDALSPVSLAFLPQQMGTTSAVQQVVLTNAGDEPLTKIAVQVSSIDFTAMNGCGNSLNAHSTCAINISYTPRSIGGGSGTLVVSDQFRSQTVGLNGNAVAPPGVSLSPIGAMAFPATGVGSTSVAQTVMLTNNGGLPLVIQAISVSGSFVMSPGGGCGSTLPPESSCAFMVQFVPVAAGANSGSLVISDNAPNSPQTLTLTGTGSDFSFVPSGSTTADIPSGKSATYPLLLTAVGGTSGFARFTCSGVPVNATCVVSPESVALGPTTLVTVTVATGVSSTALQTGGPLSHSRASRVLFAGLLPLGVLFLRRRRSIRLLGVLAVLCVVAGGGCGSGRLIPGAGNPTPIAGAATPPGVYTLTIAASAAGLVRTTTLSLIVK